MDYEKLFPGRFIKSVDLDGRSINLTIKAIRTEDIDGKTKAILAFEETKKELVTNRTNAESIKLMFGRETNDWIGKRITVYPVTIPDPFSSGSMTKAIRVQGSPDIAKPETATVQRGRKTIRVSVVPTRSPKRGNAATPPPAPEPQPEPPPHDEQTGEVFDGDRLPADGDLFS